MPIDLLPTSPVGVLPQTLFTQFFETRLFPMLSQQYHDGTTERALIIDTVNPAVSLKSWKLQVRRNAADIATLRTFYESHYGPLMSFFFYSPFEPETGHAIGSNYDPTGDGVYGRYACKFLNQQWVDAYDIARANVNIEILEVA